MRRTGLAVLVSLALSGCLYPPEDMPGAQQASYGGGIQDTTLVGDWVIDTIDGTPVGGAKGTMIFQGDNHVAGRAFCNAYHAKYKERGATMAFGSGAETKTAFLTFKPAVATKMACPDGTLMVLESKFFTAFQAVQSYTITPDGTLSLSGGGHTITARRG
jgi:heat shock protein HslJ